VTALYASEPRTRPLSNLLAGLVSLDPDLASIAVSNLTLDSRKVKSGSLFIAMRGNKADGRDFVSYAMNSGAAAVLVENDIKGIDHVDGICLAIPDLRSKVGVIADRFFDHPSSRLFVIGVTGTNGKTSCAFLLTQALNALGKKSGFIGTTGWGFDGNLQKSELTTPDSVTLQSQLSQLVTAGAQGVCLEVSSHALDQRRVEGVEFSSAIFTNLGRDHLDYHKNLNDYLKAKLYLFEILIKKRGNVITDQSIPEFKKIKKITLNRNLKVVTKVTKKDSGLQIDHFVNGQSVGSKTLNNTKSIHLSNRQLWIKDPWNNRDGYYVKNLTLTRL